MITNQHPGASKSHIGNLNLLRGIAVLMVCASHIAHALADNAYAPETFFKLVDTYGRNGVQIFFVISGFVIPVSFYQGNYTIKNYSRFLYKRLLRLHPPYILALAFTLVVMYISYRANHIVFPETALSIIKSFFYIHSPAHNRAFWTLAVEAQYYLFIGLFYSVLTAYPKLSASIATLVIIVFLNLASINNHSILLHSYLIYFLIGNIGFLIYTRAGSALINYLSIAALIVCLFLFYNQAAAIASLFAIIMVLYFKKPVPQLFNFFGHISYSLYLIHFPIVIELISLVKRHFSPSYAYLFFVATFIPVIILSWLFYKIIEIRSERMSKKIKYELNP